MRRILILSVLLALTACIYPYSPELPEQKDLQVLVVSGDIIAGEDSYITLRMVSPLGTPSSATRANTTDGIVELRNTKGRTVKGGKKVSPGCYLLSTGDLNPNDRYKLRIIWKGHTYETPLMKVQPAPEITKLDYTVDDSHMNVRISLDGGADLTDFRWDFSENWEYHAWFVPDVMFVPGASPNENPAEMYREPLPTEDYYYCWNSREGIQPCVASTSGLSENLIKDRVFHSIARTDARVSVLYSILVTARGVSPECRAYIEYQNSTSNITGDLFTPVPSHMKGNIRCITDSTRLAVGYVEATRVTAKRLFVDYAGVYVSTVNPYYYLYYPELDEEENKYHFDDLYAAGDAPVYVNSEMVPIVPTKTNVQWAPKWCSDCRESGGNKNKPEWWPNNHK